MRFTLTLLAVLAALGPAAPANACLVVGPPTAKIAQINEALLKSDLKAEERAEVVRLRDRAQELSAKPNYYEANRTAETALSMLGIKSPPRTTRC